MKEPTIATLLQLFSVGFANIPESWSISVPVQIGLLWKGEKNLHFATPLLLELTKDLNDNEKVALLLGMENRYREVWLNVLAQKLQSYGYNDELFAEMCSMIDQLGAAASVLVDQIEQAKKFSASFPATEQSCFGNPISHPATHPILVRILGRTAHLLEGKQGQLQSPLSIVHWKTPTSSWKKGRLLQEPRFVEKTMPATFVLSGVLQKWNSQSKQVEWVSQQPWYYLLALLVFSVEAWNAERQGWMKLNFDADSGDNPLSPSMVGVIVQLPDNSEVDCGSLGEFLLYFLQILDMAVIPLISATRLNQHLSEVITELLKAKVWKYDATNTSYKITEDFSRNCYRSLGFQIFSRESKNLVALIREAAVSLANRKRAEFKKED